MSDIPEGWEFKQLQEVCAVNPRQKLELNDNDYVSFIPMDAVSNDAKLLYSKKRPYRNLAKGYTSFLEGDVLFAKITPCMENGKGAHVKGLVNGVGFGSTEFHVLRAKNEVSSEFIYQLSVTKTFRLEAESNMTGSAGQKRVPTDFLKHYKILLPPLHEQRKIAAILTSVDRSIETTERMIGKLEDLKKAMMQELLTHGLPSATAAKHGIPKSGKSKASAVGQIPEEWEVVRLGDVVDVVGGGTPSSKENAYWNGDLPWANPTDITALNGRYIRETNRYITETGLSKSSAKLLPVGTVVMTSRATIGYTAINLVPMATNQGFQSLICGDKVYNEFLHYLISECRDKLTNIAAGSTFREISSSEVRIYQIKLPPMSEQKTIASILTSIDTRIAKARQRRDKLQALKKGLMQDLLTGRVRVGRCPALPWQARCGINS